MPLLSSEGGVQVFPQLLVRREVPQNSPRCKWLVRCGFYEFLLEHCQSYTYHEFIDSLQVWLPLLEAQLQLQAPEEDGRTHGSPSSQRPDDEHASYGFCHARDARYG
jgi:hypothetical protein